VSKNVHEGILRLISGKVNSQYKADFEKVTKLYSDSAIKVIHLSITKFTLMSSKN
jgi:hypothetical protein